MDLLDIGNELKNERELQGLSLENVHEDTRIGIDFLRSLEQGKIEHLSHPVYAKGFVRSYAHYLGLDSERIAEDFSSVFQTEDQFDKINPEDLPTSLRTSLKTGKSLSYIMIAGIALALMIVVGLGWFIYHSYNSRLTDQEQDFVSMDSTADLQMNDSGLPYISDRPEGFPADDDPVGVEVDEDMRVSEMTLEPLASLGPDQAVNEADEAVEQEFLPEQTIPDPQDRAQVEHEVLPDYEKAKIVIQAREECWLRIIADQSTREVYLRPGESVSAEFEQFVQLTLGNAGGVDLFLNGSPYSFDAVSGQVKTLRISPSDAS